jgi:hypothetical protein
MASGPDFNNATKQTLANRAGQVCSNPECRKPTSGPRSDESKAINLDEAAHIRSARPGQARYDASMTDKERAEISNGIWLCKEKSVHEELTSMKPNIQLPSWPDGRTYMRNGYPEENLQLKTRAFR